MDLSKRLSLSYYKIIATLNEDHKVYLVQHQETNKIFVKKELSVYNYYIYKKLQENSIPGIPKIIELFEIDNTLTVIEEYISGETLESKLTTGLSKNEILDYINEICLILDNLHTQNPPIIHRDIKPSNIIINASNQVTLIDFNAAKYFSNDKSQDTVLLGTKGYAAPEQYGFGESSPKTDIYALGILIKELFSTLNSSISTIDKLITKCTMINPLDRFESVKEIQKSINSISLNEKVKNPLLPPGFRTKNSMHMFWGAIGYFFIILFSLTINVKNTTPTELIHYKIVYFLMFSSIVFICFNYLNIQRYLPLCRSKYRVIRYFGIFILNLIFFIIYVIIFAFIRKLLG